MVHMFRCADLNLLLDVESGALHVLSDQAAAVAELFLQNLPKKEIVSRLGDMETCDVITCIGELEELRHNGLLDTPQESPDVIDDGGIVKALCLHVAHDCNLRCGYCFASTGDFSGQRSLMPFSVGKAALDFLVAHSQKRRNLEVDFFGGEPMMNVPVVRRIVEYGRQLEKEHNKVIHFTMTTNCYEVPDGAIEFCNAEMHNLVLSIDGRRGVHDAIRRTSNGGPSYDRVLKNAQAMIQNRGEREYYARGTFTRRNLDFVPDAQALWDAGFAHVSIEPVVLDAGHPLALREEDLPAIFDSYDRLLADVVQRKRAGRPHHFFHFSIDLAGGPCLRKRLSGCGCGREYLAVTPQGTLYPCHQFVGRAGFAIGDVFDGIQKEDIRTRFTKNHIYNKPQCRQCFAKYYCAGGCAANAHSFSGSLFEPNPLECAMLKKRTECALALSAIDAMGDTERP